MNTNTRKTVTVDGKALRYSIDGRPVICAILAEMEAKDREVFLGDPGMVAIGQRVGYQSTGVEQAVATFDQPQNRAIAQRLRDANAYLDRTCVAFDHDVAAATGMLLNAAKAATKAASLTTAQNPWKADAKEGLLISSEGIGAFYSAAARIDLEIQVDQSGRTEKASAAEWLRRIQVRQFGTTAEVQAHNAATAIAEEQSRTASTRPRSTRPSARCWGRAPTRAACPRRPAAPSAASASATAASRPARPPAPSPPARQATATAQ